MCSRTGILHNRAAEPDDLLLHMLLCRVSVSVHHTELLVLKQFALLQRKGEINANSCAATTDKNFGFLVPRSMILATPTWRLL